MSVEADLRRVLDAAARRLLAEGYDQAMLDAKCDVRAQGEENDGPTK
jgi:hypothetical protein